MEATSAAQQRFHAHRRGDVRNGQQFAPVRNGHGQLTEHAVGPVDQGEPFLLGQHHRIDACFGQQFGHRAFLAVGTGGDTFRNGYLMDKFGIQVNKTSRNTVLLMTNIGTTRSAVAYLIEVLVQLAEAFDEEQAGMSPLALQVPGPRAGDHRRDPRLHVRAGRTGGARFPSGIRLPAPGLEDCNEQVCSAARSNFYMPWSVHAPTP
jgi:hypothetical protein